MTRLNGEIRAPRLRVIDEDGSQLGILSLREAISIAEERDLDLVEISPEADPPIAKITDWGKCGNKVKFNIVYKGREQAHKELGFTLANKIMEKFGDTIIVDQSPTLAGRQLSFVIRSNHAKVKNS
ncbi:hypothetical protein EBR37_02085 [bacterium]|nr:hypothetical protein [bacterium]